MDLDQFYTNENVAEHCLKIAKNYLDFDSYDIFLEPSAGAGAFYSLLSPNNRVGIDIDPKLAGIQKQDFLNFIPELTLSYLTIGNPPFGKNSSLAVKFFNKAANFSDAICFILPRTFRKKRLQNRLNRNFHLICDVNVPEYSFNYNQKPYDVPCLFQIWMRKTPKRELHLIFTKSNDFEFTSKSLADFSCQRVGVGAGTIRLKGEMEDYSEQSNWFIKAKSNNVLEIFYSLNFEAVKYNTAGNPSISAGELVELYENFKVNKS